MRSLNLLLFFILLFVNFNSFGQVSNIEERYSISIDFGSYRNRYLYPITNLSYNSPTLHNFKFSTRLRSYGTLYVFTKSAYDVSPILEYRILPNEKLKFYAGIGLDVQLRLVNDTRSSATSAIIPIVSLNLSSNYKRSSFKLSNWNRFYTNGYSISFLPTIQYRISSKLDCYFRYEINYLNTYNHSTHECLQDLFIGTQFSFCNSEKTIKPNLKL